MAALRTSTKNLQIRTSLMPNYVFLILRKFHLIIFQVLETSFKQKEYRITWNISERSQLIKSRGSYLIERTNPRNEGRSGVFIDPSKVQQFAMGKPTHSQVTRDFGWSQEAMAEGEPLSPQMDFSPRAVSQSKLHCAVASGEMAQPKAAHKDIPRHWDWCPAHWQLHVLESWSTAHTNHPWNNSS